MISAIQRKLFLKKQQEEILEKQNKLQEKQPLPTGVTEFHAWADRIIKAAELVAEPDSQKFALANMLMHLGPNVAFESDFYFIATLRKHAVNQVADHMRTKIRDDAKARLTAPEKQNSGDVTPPAAADGKVLEIKTV